MQDGRQLGMMVRKSIGDFKRKNTVLTARQEHLRGASGEQLAKDSFHSKKCCLNGWSRYRTTFHSGNIFVVRFAVHRLGVSGLLFRLLSRFRTVGGGSLLFQAKTERSHAPLRFIVYSLHRQITSSRSSSASVRSERGWLSR